MNKHEQYFSGFWERIDELKYEKQKHKPKKKRSRIPGYVATIVVNAILLWVAHKLPDWTQVLNNDYTKVLWVFNILFIATMAINFLYILLDKAWFRASMQLILNIIAFFAYWNLYQIFPFDFTQSTFAQLETVIRIVLIVSLVGIGIGTIVEFAQMVLGFNLDKEEI